MTRPSLSGLVGLALVVCAASASAHPRLHAHAHGAAPRVVVMPVPRIAPRCAVHGCSATITATGPHDATVDRSSSAAYTGGICTRSRAVTGPGGAGASRSLSISR